MEFVFEKSAAQRLREVLIGVPIVLALMAAGALYMIYGAAAPVAAFFGKMLLALTLLAAAVFAVWAFALWSRGARWLIRIGDEAVSWQAPRGVGDASFEVRLADIDKVVCESWGDIETEDRYFLLAGQQRYPLNHASSGMDIHRFVRTLEAKGIAYERVSASR